MILAVILPADQLEAMAFCIALWMVAMSKMNG